MAKREKKIHPAREEALRGAAELCRRSPRIFSESVCMEKSMAPKTRQVSKKSSRDGSRGGLFNKPAKPEKNARGGLYNISHLEHRQIKGQNNSPDKAS